MSNEGLYITRVECNQLVKKIDNQEEYVRNSMRKGTQPEWIKSAEAMEMIGCKQRKLVQLRLSGRSHWRYAGNNRGVMIPRSSVGQYNMSQSTILPPTIKTKSR